MVAGYEDASVRDGHDSTAGNLLKPQLEFKGVVAPDRPGRTGPFAQNRSQGGYCPCIGALGEPAYALRDGRWFVFGTMSFGEEHCGEENASYSFLPATGEWIRAQAAQIGVVTITWPDVRPPVSQPPVWQPPQSPEQPLPPPPLPGPAASRDPRDLATHPLAYDIRTALTPGLIQGYIDGTFRPDATISRLETALPLAQLVGHSSARANETIGRGHFLVGIDNTLKMILEGTGQPRLDALMRDGTSFSDVPAGHWVEGYARVLSGFCATASATDGVRLDMASNTTKAYAASAGRAFECLKQRAPGAVLR